MNQSSWANGAAPMVLPATTEDTETILVVSDIHVPFHDPALVDSAIRLTKKLKPHRVVLNGDIADFFQLSRFNQGLERLDSLQEEIDASNKIRAAFRKAAPNAVIDETEGNHDHRMRSYVATKGRALTSLRALEPESLFQTKELEIVRFDGAGFRPRQNFLIKHGTIIRKHAGYSAKAELEAAGISGVSGHTHRLSVHRQTGYVARQWAEGGCLCLTEPDYVIGPANWQPGAIIVQASTKTDSFLIEEVQAHEGRLWYGGKSF